MNVELLRVSTRDGVRLDGGLSVGDNTDGKLPIDAALLLHGTGANFYASSLLTDLAERFQAAGVATLLANTRGRDLAYLAQTPAGAVRLGAAYELVADCLHDIAAWYDCLQARGYQRIVLVGHSLGAIKGVYALSQAEPPPFACLCAISPARLSCSYFLQSPRAEEFRDTLKEAQRLVAAGHGGQLMDVQFPLPYLVTAAGYLDKYGPDERYNVLQHVPNLRLPSLFTFGTQEVAENVTFRGLPEDIAAATNDLPHLRTALVAGADHVYSGARAELFARIKSWLANLPMQPL